MQKNKNIKKNETNLSNDTYNDKEEAREDERKAKIVQVKI